MWVGRKVEDVLGERGQDGEGGGNVGRGGEQEGGKKAGSGAGWDVEREMIMFLI